VAATKPAERVSLRERKKLRTRQTIVETAIRLFTERGFQETTLIEIAAEAEIAPSTFFNYFSSKVDIVFGLTDAIIESAQQRVLERSDDETATEAVLDWVLGDLAVVEQPYSELMRSIPRIVGSEPELSAASRLRLVLLEDVFAEAYGRDLGESPDGVHARVMATIVLRGMAEVWSVWYEQHVTDAIFNLREALQLKADYLGEALAIGLELIAVLPPTPPAS
jgi:AcrR family transcriptional regulator